MLLCESRKQTLANPFFYLIDTALINSWIIYKYVCNSIINRRMFIQRFSEELTRCTPKEKLQIESNADVVECAPTPKNAKLVLTKTAET